MQNRLYVGNLPFDINAQAIEQAFAAHGSVTDVHVVMDRETNRPRGFAFVTMGTDSEAQEAISQMDGVMLGGRALRVNQAEAKPARTGGSGGGPNRGGSGGGFGGGDRRPRY
ncbi:MAG: RNA-binding protein [Planctomycetes bacterium]|nr:RNA-binding protein [Planctomycetota bacterium]